MVSDETRHPKAGGHSSATTLMDRCDGYVRRADNLVSSPNRVLFQSRNNIFPPRSCESLHRRIVDNLAGKPNADAKSKPIQPGLSCEVRRWDDRGERSGKTDRYCVVRTTLRNLLRAGNHLLCCHSGPETISLFCLAIRKVSPLDGIGSVAASITAMRLSAMASPVGQLNAGTASLIQHVRSKIDG